MNRRSFLQAAAAVSAIATSPRTLRANEGDLLPQTVIDAHTHFYDPARPQGVPWPAKKDAVLYRTTLPADLHRVAPRVTGTVVVEASPWLEDNQWILDLAEHEPLIVGFIGHLDPGTPGFAEHIHRFARNRLFRGIRIQGQGLPQKLDQPEFVRDLQLLADNDLALDVNGTPALLPGVALLAARLPSLRVVINHLANLQIDGRSRPADWLAGMQAVSKFPKVYCKVSALVEGAGRNGAKPPADVEFYRPVLDCMWSTLGEDRLIYGSNWPVSEKYAPYSTVQHLVAAYLQAKSDSVREKFFSRNAQAAYKWVAR
jgi:L-fuconolactonase